MVLSALLADALAQTTFRFGSRTETAEDLRVTLDEAHWGSDRLRDALAVRVEVPDEVLEPLVAALRQRLAAYLDVDTDSIGHSFDVMGQGHASTGGNRDFVMENQSTSTVSGVAVGLVRAAAALGPAEAARLMGGWVTGEPLRFKVCMVLGGGYVSEELQLDAGVRLSALPTSSDLLPKPMPGVDRNRVIDILGQPLLEIEAFTRPVFFSPPVEGGSFPELDSVTVLSPAPVDLFLLALSLVSDRHVGMAWAWCDFGAGRWFSGGRTSGLMGPGPVSTRRLGRRWSHSLDTGVVRIDDLRTPASDVSARRLQRAWELLPLLNQRHNGDARFRIAVDRWYKSRSRSLTGVDRALELRIALEALFLDGAHGELRFRLATTGARYLGVGLSERQEVAKVLRDFYDRASQAVHAAGIDFSGGDDAELLRQASGLCRRGILKVLEEKGRPVWSDVLLS